jgi:hypothetical protein
MASLKLYDYAASGNCYKVRLLVAQMGRPYERGRRWPALRRTTRAPSSLRISRALVVTLLSPSADLSHEADFDEGALQEARAADALRCGGKRRCQTSASSSRSITAIADG